MQSEITLISVAGMIHDWATPGKANANEDPNFSGKPFDVNGSEEAWAYLKTQSLNESGYRLTISTRGRGTLSRNPEEESYEKESQVIITATPSDGWVFESWSGDASGNQNPLTVTMNASKEITANFTSADGKQDLILNGNFSSGANSWTFNNWNGSGTGSVVDGEYQITVSTVSDNYYDIQVVQPGILLQQGKTYRLIYDAYASAPRVLNINIGMPEDPWTTFLTSIVAGESENNLTTSKQTFILDFTMQEATYDNSRVEFSAGTDAPIVYIDNVSLFEIEPASVTVLVKNRSTKQIDIRRNGANVNVTFNACGNGSAFIDIYNLKGGVIRSKSIKASGSTQNFSFNTTGIPEGYYVVKISSGNTVKRYGLMLTGR